MTIINQPFQGQLGDILINELSSTYNEFTIFSAFAKNSGVLRMKEAMTTFRKNGGTINAFIGIDLDGTSYEALLNLYNLCDNLYVIHSENFNTTYHSKVYLLKNDTTAWCAVGSNNLTGGGLWTNFESCSIENYSLSTNPAALINLQELIEKYCNEEYTCSSRISSFEDINALLEANYISKEVTQRITSITRQVNLKKKHKQTKLFGTEKVSIPTLINIEKQVKDPKQKEIPIDISIRNTSDTPAFTNEQFWFEMRESTGGSRNILDLSKLGRIETGTVNGTAYESTKPSYMLGGIKFFEIDPEDTTRTKNITINYLGKDYFPSTIKFTPNNGSWRIQLKGNTLDNTDELSKFGNRGDFVHKILVFEKISSDYYVLSLLDESELNHVKSISRVWARNGRNRSSRAYGML